MAERNLSSFLVIVMLGGCGLDEQTTTDEATIEQAVSNAPLSTQPAWSVIISNNGAWCSASIVNEHWLLTAASCVESQPEYVPALEVSYASSPGLKARLYLGPAHRIANPSHPGSSNAVHDVALIYLQAYGLDLANTGKSKLYADTRRPWRTSSEPNDMAIAGWGYGSSPGSDDCNPPGQKLRLGTGLHVDVDYTHPNYASAMIPDTHMCDGDGGGQYLLYRGTGSDADYMQFAVHSGRRVTPGNPFPMIKHQGALLEDNIAWIESTINAWTSYVFSNQWLDGYHGGYKYRQSALGTHGFGPIGGFEYRCMHAAGGTTNRVELRTCDASFAQRWNFEISGEITQSALLRERRCLEIEGASTANRTPMRVATCNGSPAQRFGYTTSGEIRSAKNWNKCVESGGSGNGAPVQLFDCNGTGPQMWLPGTTGPID